jgi:outer membrane protein
MRRTVAWTIVAILGLTVSPAFAGKIGFVRAERAVASTKEGKAVLSELQEWSQQQEARLQQMRDQLQRLDEEIRQKRAVVSDDVLKNLQDQDIALRRRLEDEARKLNRELDDKQDKILRPVAEKLNTVVTDYAKANDYDAIFIWKDMTMIYVADGADLTDLMVRMYDERFPPTGK